MLSLLLAPLHAAAQTLVDFDDRVQPCSFSLTDPLGTEYQADGVVFSGVGRDGGAVLNECGGFGVRGHSPPNFLAYNSGAATRTGGIPRPPQTMTFDPPASRVTFSAGCTAGGTLEVEAFDANGQLVDAQSLGMSSTLGAVTVQAPVIRTVVFDTVQSVWVMDDLEFELDGDPDGDGLQSSNDNCPEVWNPQQADADGDLVGDDCDDCPLDPLNDPDDDGICGSVDVCPTVADPLQIDRDRDGAGDACDPCPRDNPDDTDLDTVCDSDDVCPGQDDTRDTDNDGFPNGCDDCPFDANGDSDGDGRCDSDDLCPGHDDARDADGDGFPDDCDVCPTPRDPHDADGDTVCDGDDVCPDGDDRVDTDADATADACDPCPVDAPDDTDGDGVCDVDDLCPDHDDTGPDQDDDGWVDGCDNCGSVWNDDQRDYDKDGFGDLCDCRIGKPEIHPGADEVCNEDDDDCDGEIDEDALDAVQVWPDADGDGQGNAAAPWNACQPGDGYVSNGDDCDDAHAEALVGGLEICDQLDNDCDGTVDPADLNCDPDMSIPGESRICGCDATGATAGGLPLLGLALLLRRRRAAC